ncbi:sigma-70 family RNA polymerase sigma factor [Rhizobium deserti]|uniref:Sigma-70 family RNA polymerase sigma factor n=1 Tax=Rhizobium deserti TaxID=2547961 RepID=A0A4R5UH29_9HYPH|nr:sigma-70 family RNA polymerase sigma factor [Rhizobium deserti]TDK35235.1 sigma-70 family RNA polymerase sigma factor [Rhizobium deserti]
MSFVTIADAGFAPENDAPTRETRLAPVANASTDLESALAACASGDRNGLRLIFDSEAGRLVAVAERIVRRRDLAEEVVQEAFIRVWTHARQYAPERGSARGWVTAIVRNRALNMLRDGREDLIGEDRLETLQETDQIDQILAAWNKLDRNSRLRECLGTLDETKRNGILMAYVGGYTHGEIAGRLRIPLGTTKSWIRRGLAALRECMA